MVLWGGGVGVAHCVDDHLGQVDGGALQGSTGVEPGEEEQVLDEAAHPLGLRLDAAHRVADRLRHRVALAAGELGIPADRGERGT